jgi:glutathione peroxidase
MRLYDFSVLTAKGDMTSLAVFKGNVLLIVNTASQCGFTPQYQQLQALQDKFGPDKFSVLAFPCDQFGNQEPGSNDAIQTFCQLNYGVTFPVMAKIAVNGPQAAPLFTYLKSECPGILGSKGIKWNFTKFLIDGSGQPVKRYAPIIAPNDLITDIQNLMTSH